MDDSMKGFIFSSDAAFSVLLIFTACAVFLSHMAGIYSAQKEEITEFSEFRKASALLNSFVNDRNEGSPLYGSAFYDSGKKRVMEGMLDSALLEKAEAGLYLGNNFFLQKISLIFEDNPEETINEIAGGSSCFSLERFVLVKYALEARKAKIRTRFCHE